MEKELDQHGTFVERSFPEYKPHATLAYVKPETARMYTGNPVTNGKKFLVKSVSISKKDGSIRRSPTQGTGRYKGCARGESGRNLYIQARPKGNREAARRS